MDENEPKKEVEPAEPPAVALPKTERAVETPTADTKADAEEEEREKRWQRLRKRLEVAAFALGFVVAGTGIWQGLETRRSNDLTREAFDKANKDRDADIVAAKAAAEKAETDARAEADERKRIADAEAAERTRIADKNIELALRSLKESEKRFALQQRPWLGIEATKRVVVKVGERPDVDVAFINAGLTPATDIRVCSMFGGTTPAASYPSCMGRTEFALSVLVPGATSIIPATVEKPLTQEQFDALKSGKIKFYIHGWLEYGDTLNPGAKHVLTYCSFWIPETNDFRNYPSPHCGKTYDIPANHSKDGP